MFLGVFRCAPQWAIFPIWRTESPKLKLCELKQSTIYGLPLFPSHVVKFLSVREWKSSTIIGLDRVCSCYKNTSENLLFSRKFYHFVCSLVVRAPDSGTEGLGSKPVPPNTLRVHTE
ncbi:hypothetical protein TNCV_4071771 [Trichonephila clavipes]|uniref:Uncharacterized protein n=1 Tax=Trichonephila clavipes TaxID=2585209 RepID=A0A8X6W8J8_TRICX|nr:hypothetical protein TNCV_4071771 [Trichonephila clavipes]